MDTPTMRRGFLPSDIQTVTLTQHFCDEDIQGGGPMDRHVSPFHGAVAKLQVITIVRNWNYWEFYI